MLRWISPVAALAALIGACSLQTGVVPPIDADAGADDTGVSVGDSATDSDGAMDSTADTAVPRDTSLMDTSLMDAMDTSAMDTSPPDTTPPPDTAPPDTAPPDTGPPMRVGCNAAYSGETGYLLCAMRPDDCEFYVDPPTTASCDTVCSRNGGTCITRYDETDDSGGRCTRDGERLCSEASNDYICVCTRPFM